MDFLIFTAVCTFGSLICLFAFIKLFKAYSDMDQNTFVVYCFLSFIPILNALLFITFLVTLGFGSLDAICRKLYKATR